MTPNMKRSFAVPALLLSSALFGACGGGDENPTDPPFVAPISAPDGGGVATPQPEASVPNPVPDAGGTIPTTPVQTRDSSVSNPVGEAGAPDAGTPDGGGAVADGGADGATMGTGMCCPDGNCLCHGDVPTKLSGTTKGPFKTAMVTAKTGTIYYPTDAEPPFAAIALCGGFLNTGPEMADWGPFYASYGIVVLITTTGALDLPDQRADELLASIAELKAITTGPLAGKLSGRYGTSGYSMGGGGTLIAANKTPALLTSVSLAAWGPDAAMDKVPSLLFCGTADTVAPCGDHSDPAYAQIPATTPKMKMMITGGDHLSAWFGPADGGGGISGGYALAFQKVFLEGDTRWKPLLLTKPSGSTQETNIK
jgi:hypothetical protein